MKDLKRCAIIYVILRRLATCLVLGTLSYGVRYTLFYFCNGFERTKNHMSSEIKHSQHHIVIIHCCDRIIQSLYMLLYCPYKTYTMPMKKSYRQPPYSTPQRRPKHQNPYSAEHLSLQTSPSSTPYSLCHALCSVANLAKPGLAR